MAATPSSPARRRRPIVFYRELAALGFQYFVTNTLGGDEETVELLGTEVMPAFA